MAAKAQVMKERRVPEKTIQRKTRQSARGFENHQDEDPFEFAEEQKSHRDNQFEFSPTPARRSIGGPPLSQAKSRDHGKPEQNETFG